MVAEARDYETVGGGKLDHEGGLYHAAILTRRSVEEERRADGAAAAARRPSRRVPSRPAWVSRADFIAVSTAKAISGGKNGGESHRCASSATSPVSPPSASPPQPPLLSLDGPADGSATTIATSTLPGGPSGSPSTAAPAALAVGHGGGKVGTQGARLLGGDARQGKCLGELTQ